MAEQKSQEASGAVELNFEESLAAGETAVSELQKSELGAMFRNFKPEAEKKSALSEESEDGESGSDEAGEDGEEDEENGTSEDKKTDEVEDGKTEESADIKALKDQNAALLARVDSLLKLVEGKKPEPEKEEAPVDKDAIQQLDLTDLEASITDEMYQEAQDSKEGMGKLLAHFGGQLAQRLIQGQVGYVNNVITQAVEQRMVVKDFFAKNPDLVEHRTSVATAYKLLQAEHTDWDMAKVMDSLAPTVRIMKGLAEPKKDEGKQLARNTANAGSRFSKASGGKQLPKPKDKNSIGSQIAKMKGR